MMAVLEELGQPPPASSAGNQIRIRDTWEGADKDSRKPASWKWWKDRQS